MSSQNNHKRFGAWTPILADTSFDPTPKAGLLSFCQVVAESPSIGLLVPTPSSADMHLRSSDDQGVLTVAAWSSSCGNVGIAGDDHLYGNRGSSCFLQASIPHVRTSRIPRSSLSPLHASVSSVRDTYHHPLIQSINHSRLHPCHVPPTHRVLCYTEDTHGSATSYS